MKQVEIKAAVACEMSGACPKYTDGSCGFISLLTDYQPIDTIIFDPKTPADMDGSLEQQKEDLLAGWGEKSFGPCTDNPFGRSIQLHGDTSSVSVSSWKNV